LSGQKEKEEEFESFKRRVLSEKRDDQTSPQKAPEPGIDLQGIVKKIVNDSFIALRLKFDIKKEYKGLEVLTEVKNILVEKTMGAIEKVQINKEPENISTHSEKVTINKEPEKSVTNGSGSKESEKTVTNVTGQINKEPEPLSSENRPTENIERHISNGETNTPPNNSQKPEWDKDPKSNVEDFDDDFDDETTNIRNIPKITNVLKENLQKQANPVTHNPTVPKIDEDSLEDLPEITQENTTPSTKTLPNTDLPEITQHNIIPTTPDKEKDKKPNKEKSESDDLFDNPEPSNNKVENTTPSTKTLPKEVDQTKSNVNNLPQNDDSFFETPPPIIPLTRNQVTKLEELSDEEVAPKKAEPKITGTLDDLSDEEVTPKKVEPKKSEPKMTGTLDDLSDEEVAPKKVEPKIEPKKSEPSDPSSLFGVSDETSIYNNNVPSKSILENVDDDDLFGDL